MENTLKKDELIAQLRANNIDFSANAKVADLRKIYAEKMKKHSNGNSDGTTTTATKTGASSTNTTGDDTATPIEKNVPNSASNQASASTENLLNDISNNNNSDSATNKGVNSDIPPHSNNNSDTNNGRLSPVIPDHFSQTTLDDDIERREQEELEALLLRVPKTKKQIELNELAL